MRRSAQHVIAEISPEHRHGVDQGREGAPDRIGPRVIEAALLYHVEHEQRRHAVIAEAFPDLDAEQHHERPVRVAIGLEALDVMGDLYERPVEHV